MLRVQRGEEQQRLFLNFTNNFLRPHKNQCLSCDAENEARELECLIYNDAVLVRKTMHRLWP